MRPTLALNALIAVMCGVGVYAQATFRTSTDAVAVYAVVTDRSGRPVDNLSAEDFRVEDRGRQVPITLFSRERQPLSVALLLDTSESTLGKVFRIRDAARAFVHALEPDDRVRIGTFGDEIAISAAATGRRDVLDRVLLEELWPGGSTPLWNALDSGMSAVAREPGRRVVITVTDGDNTASLPGFNGTLAGVQRRAVAEDFMLYAIGMEGGALSKAIVDLTETTGGAHVNVKRDADLDVTFAAVTDELRHHYLLGFVPATRDGQMHALTVRVTRSGLNVRSRRAYVAASQPLDSSDARTEPTVAPPPRPDATSGETRTVAVILDATVGNDNIADVAAWLGMSSAADRLMLGVMTRDVAWSSWAQDRTAQRAWLLNTTGAADAQQRRYGPSPIWDAVGAAVSSLAATPGARDVILISDGRASGNREGSTDVAARARAAGIRVSTIVTHRAQPLNLGRGMAMLLHPEYQPKAVATATGGLCVERVEGQTMEPLAAAITRVLAARR